MIASLFYSVPTNESNSISNKKKPVRIFLKPEENSLSTKEIQLAIDSCSGEGGGVIHFMPGTYLTGTINLRNNIALFLEKGVIIQGSDKYSDYTNDSFFFGKDLSDITITGEGVIDGVDCYNPKGEEGFRGPHCIRLINCINIKIEGITIKNSANWAINCRKCSAGNVTNVTILGGHDGLHTRFCSDFTVRGCDFRTGDDAFAGNDNLDFKISDCQINTSCNGFRMGCMNLKVEHCRFWGPGEYVHKIQKRHNMLSAFVHFSPKDEKPQLKSGNWIIRDITVENVDNFYIYNYKNGLWQTGQPVTSVKFENVKAKGLLKAFYLYGDSDLRFDLSIKNSEFTFREGAEYPADAFEGAKLVSPEFFYAIMFGVLYLDKVTFTKQDPSLIFKCESGKKVKLNRVSFNNLSGSEQYKFDKIAITETNHISINERKIANSKQ